MKLAGSRQSGNVSLADPLDPQTAKLGRDYERNEGLINHMEDRRHGKRLNWGDYGKTPETTIRTSFRKGGMVKNCRDYPK
jgi:hypothetical protein